MKLWKRYKEQGVSLRAVSVCTVVLEVLISVLLIIQTTRSVAAFRETSDATDSYITLQRAAYELMNASDYLTEEAQCFTVNGDTRHMDNYFREAFETRRRENAISEMSAGGDPVAVAKLRHAMDFSLNLMQREYYAMKLVLTAQGVEDFPEELRGVELTAEHLALSPDEQIELARTMLHDEAYYEQKAKIRQNMNECVQELEQGTHSAQRHSLEELRRELNRARAMIAVLMLGVMLMMFLNSRLGINPVLRAVQNIREDSPLPVIGANEFRYLARTYNKMYAAYKKIFENLNYKASHDALTGLYNRAGYDLLMSSLDRESTVMLLLDADRFKQINDTYGHEVGDKVLKKIAGAIRHNFRSDDYACRIGGDEFAVLMVHVDDNREALIRSKLRRINRELGETDDGLPPITVSAGAANGKNSGDMTQLFEQADHALYEAKQNGHRGYVVYSGQ